VCECIGEEWKSPLQISLLEVCLPQGVQGLWLATFLPVQRGAELARLIPRAKRAKSDCNPWVSKMCMITQFSLESLYNSFEDFDKSRNTKLRITRKTKLWLGIRTASVWRSEHGWKSYFEPVLAIVMDLAVEELSAIL
jgi:hypothetical protein